MRSHHRTPLAVAAVLLGALPVVLSGQTEDGTARAATEEGRTLRHQVTVDAPPDSVWRVFTTSTGLRSFVAPVAEIELRVGGRWEASYDPEARIGDPGNIVNEILSYLPGEMLSIRVARAPPGFPFPDAVKELWTVIQFEETERGGTRVTSTMLGFGRGAPWDALRAAFERDNATILRRLRRRFAAGPVDWSEDDRD